MVEYTPAFERAVAHAMVFEVGPWFVADRETTAGLIATPAQRRKVGYVNDPVDAGGETKFGIAKSGNANTDITALTWPDAKQIYFDRYWIAGGCLLLAPRVAILHFDGCINHGVGKASKFLQEVVGAGQDGQVGPGTAAKSNAMNELDVCRFLCARRTKFYNDIVAAKPAQIKFLRGWLARIKNVQDFVLGPLA